MRFNATIAVEDLRADLCRRVNAERDLIIAAGYEFGGHTYQIDPASLQAMRDAIDRGESSVEWRTSDNRMVALVAAGLQRLWIGASCYVADLRRCAMAKKDAIMIAEDPDPDVVRTGWPKN